MKKTLTLLSFILAISIILLVIVSFLLGIDGLSNLLGCDLEHISFIRPAKTYAFSLSERAPTILLLGIICIVAFLLIGLNADKVIDGARKAFSFFTNFIKTTVQQIAHSDVKYFLLLSLFASLYLAYFFPLTLDEPQTYYDFIQPSFWEALAFYPYPNNHVLSSVLSNITNEISGLDLLFRLRLPAVIISLLTWVFAYRFVKKFFSENLAILVVAVGTVVVTNLQHAYIARGYAFVMFFVVIGLYAAFNIIKEGNRKRDWIAFALSTALGAWTMPSYLYPFLSISIFIFIYNYKYIKTQILYSVLIALLVFMLYSPILIFSGIEAITSNEFVEIIDRLTVLKSIPGFMLGTVVHIFYVPFYILLCVFVLVLLLALIRRDKNTLIFWAVFCITPCLFLIFHSVIPFFRTFFYYGFVFIFMIAIVFKDDVKKTNAKTILIASMAIHLVLLAHFFNISRDLMIDVFLSKELRDDILEDKKSYYLSDDISWIEIVNLEFEAERKRYTIKVDGGNANDVSKLQQYDYCVIGAQVDKTTVGAPIKTTKSVFSTPVNIYKREK